jgi:nucleoside-diphosphate-sugar epimerase
MKVVVTGATGNLGTALLQNTAGYGNWNVTGLARRAPEVGQAPYSAAQWVQCDIGTSEAPRVLREVFDGADAVVHLAWAINPGTNEPTAHRTNHVGTCQVLRAVMEAKVPHLVCASSVVAYTPAPRWLRVDEGWPCSGIPGSAYSFGKAWLEHLLDGFEQDHPEVRVSRIRPGGLVQRNAGTQLARWTLSPLIPQRLIGARALPVPVWPGLRAQFVHTDDVAQALRLILERRSVGAFNLAAEPVLSADGLAAVFGGARLPFPRWLLHALAWPTWRLGLQPSHPGWFTMADKVSLMTTRRAREELGWRPQHDAVSALTELVSGIRDGAGATSLPLAPSDQAPRALRWGHPSHQSQSTAL